jgi:tRNA (cytidine/uridine-2'-O-)-methyltransferase
LDIIEPCGFPLTAPALKRAALDYGAAAEVTRHASWTEFLAHPARGDGRLVLFTTAGAVDLTAFHFIPGDTLLFGRESAGVPIEVHDAARARVRIPIAGRSLNVSMSAGIALFEALRQNSYAAHS